jgi:hypothetical protein
MTKDEFLKKCAEKMLVQRELESQINEIRSEVAQLERDYVAEHREFQNGEKVLMVRAHGSKTRKITLPLTEEVIVRSATTFGRGDIVYGLRQIKKDGTASSFKADRSIDFTLQKLTK